MKTRLLLLAGFSALVLSSPTLLHAQNHASLEFTLLHNSRDSIAFKAEMVTGPGVNFSMEAVYVAATYDPSIMGVTANSVMNHGLVSAGFQKDSDPFLDTNGVNPDICLYGQSSPNFQSVPIPQNARIALCRFTFFPKAPNTPGTASFCVYGNTPTAAFTGYYITTTVDNQIFDPVVCLSNVPYPVEMSAFSAAQQGDAVLLQWTTQTETDNLGFTVERRAEGGEWEAIGFVNGHGTTRREISYIFIDQTLPANGVYQYRLRQIDMSGFATNSQPRTVLFTRGAEAFGLAQNFPNPVSAADGTPTQLRCSLPEAAQARLVITDMLGREVARLMDDHLDAGTYTRSWLPTGLASGTYIATLTAQAEGAAARQASIRIAVTR